MRPQLLDLRAPAARHQAVGGETPPCLHQIAAGLLSEYEYAVSGDVDFDLVGLGVGEGGAGFDGNQGAFGGGFVGVGDAVGPVDLHRRGRQTAAGGQLHDDILGAGAGVGN